MTRYFVLQQICRKSTSFWRPNVLVQCNLFTVQRISFIIQCNSFISTTYCVHCHFKFYIAVNEVVFCSEETQGAKELDFALPVALPARAGFGR
jgi:hypothetical protein